MNPVTQYREKTDAQRRNHLVVEHLDYVRHILSRVASSLPMSVDTENLEAAGVLGLVEAAQQYDVTRGVPFKGFAYNRIRGAILDELRRNSPLPQNMLQQVAIVRKAMESLTAPVTIEDIANATDMSADDVSDCLQAMQLTRTQTWDESLAGSHPLGKAPDDPSESLDDQELREVVADCIEQLPRQERLAITLYYLEDLRQKEVGKVLGLSESRICRLLVSAQTQLKSLVRQRLK